jgi:hypothetical protein
MPVAGGVGVEVGGRASADDAGEIAGAVVGDDGGSADVGGRSDVGVAVVVRAGRVGAVAVTLGDSVTLGAGRVPERSVEVRVADSLPPPAPQPLGPRTRPSISPARSHALPARRPRTTGPIRRSLLAGATRHDIIQDVRIDDHLRIGQGRGEHARHATLAMLWPEAGRSITRNG